eukprot:6353107-Pyramimonas_sp.AAC.1
MPKVRSTARPRRPTRTPPPVGACRERPSALPPQCLIANRAIVSDAVLRHDSLCVACRAAINAALLEEQKLCRACALQSSCLHAGATSMTA